MTIERIERPTVSGTGNATEKAVHHPLQVEPLLPEGSRGTGFRSRLFMPEAGYFRSEAETLTA